MAVILRRRLEGIDDELADFNLILRSFTSRVDEQVHDFTDTMSRLQVNLNHVKIAQNEEMGNGSGSMGTFSHRYLNNKDTANRSRD